MITQQHDRLAALRSRWFKRLSDTKQCLQITAALLSGCKEPPLSEQDLAPHLEDMLEILDCPPGAFLLDIAPGQPFGLKLWHRLATPLQDPDADFLLQLPQGVPLGVNQTLKPSPAWPEYTGTLPEEVPLQDCLDSWKSAQGHPEIVQSLIQEELDAGFIAHVPGGVPQLKQMYAKTAIGKPGVVIAPGRSPRLAVDSSISMVTANTVLPNHIALATHLRCNATCSHGHVSTADDSTYPGYVESPSQDSCRPRRWRSAVFPRRACASGIGGA